MTKKQEIAHFNAFIKTLGPDSYIGPWLQSVKGNVELMIQSDLFPDILPSQTAEIIRKQREEADNDCKGKIERATKEAEKIMKDAHTRASEIKFLAKRRLEEAIKDIDGTKY